MCGTDQNTADVELTDESFRAVLDLSESKLAPKPSPAWAGLGFHRRTFIGEMGTVSVYNDQKQVRPTPWP